MFKIVKKKRVSPDSTLYVVEAPLVARSCEPGQFIILRIDEKGERIPLTIADFDRQKGTITIIVQEVGVSTIRLNELNEGDCIRDFVGPLGKHMEVGKVGRVCTLGGGLGIAPAYPKVRALKEAGNYMVTILGARSSDRLILREEMARYSDEVYYTTDDGSEGLHGFVSQKLEQLLKEGQKYDLVVAIGPALMMRATIKVTKEFNIPTLVSLDSIMVDGTGMCGSCRVTVAGKTQFACVDGPIFDGFAVDFDEMMKRQCRYNKEEKSALDHYCQAKEGAK